MVNDHEQENKIISGPASSVNYYPGIGPDEVQNGDDTDTMNSLVSGKHKADFRAVDLALVELLQSVIKSGRKILIIIEGRDGAGKDGVIRRITKHMSPRDTRVIA